MSLLERGKLLSARRVYEGKIVDLEVDEIEISGMQTIREVVRHPGGVVILARDLDGKIPFVRQHRYPLEEDLLELPAGKLDAGEPPEVSAARELEEEVGLRPVSIRKISSFYTSPGFCDELLHFFFADEVEKVDVNPEPDEHLIIEHYSLDQAIQMIADGQIRDGKTITALYWLALEIALSGK